MPRRSDSRGRLPGQRAGLTPREVVKSARDLAERKGVDGVTIRGVASELGVAPNAIYSYFPGRTAILDALLDDVLSEIEPTDPDAGSWQDALTALMGASRRLLIAHPLLVPLFLARPGGRNAMKLGEMTLRILERGGIRGEAAALALRALLAYTFGAAALEAARLVDPERAERVARSTDAMQTLPADEFPQMRVLPAELSAHPEEKDFEAGLTWLIRGIEGG